MLMKLDKLILACFMLVFHFVAVSPANADEGLDLVIDGGVTVPWEFTNVMPGSSGVVSVDVHNNGSIDGYLAVWIDGIIDTEGENPEAETGDTAEPGELSLYLTLNISGEDISPYAASPDFELPATLNEFPQSNISPLQLSDQPIEAGETIQIQWEWAIPPQTTNVIQGDCVSFNINYILTQSVLVHKEPGGIFGSGGPTDSDEEVDEQDTIDNETDVFSDNHSVTRTYYSPDGRFIIIVPGEIKVISDGNEKLVNVIITIPEYTSPIPPNCVLLTPVYNVATFTRKGPCELTLLDKPVIMIINYDCDKVPENSLSIYAARYKIDSGWVKLTGVLEVDRAAGKLIVETTEFSLIAVFAELAVADDSREAVISSSGDSHVSDSPYYEAPYSRTVEKIIIAVSRTPMREMLRQASLIIAGCGTIAMIILAYIERKRRDIRRTIKT
jgi:hypothetical protein